MRFKLLLVLVGLGGMFVAAQKSYLVLTNLRPTRLTCAEFVNKRPGAKWVELTGCELDVDNAIGLQSRILKIDKGLFVPVRPAGAAGPATILLRTDDVDPSIGIADETESAPPGAVPGDRPTTVKTVSGLVQSGLDSDSKVRRAIDKVAQQGRITQEYVIVEAGRKPDPADLVLGIALLVGIPVIGWLVLRPRQSPVAAAGPSALPPPPLPRA